jgi:uncharacterized coiled-coil protein SlyX
MRKATDIIAGVALFLVGMAAGVLSSAPEARDGASKSTEGDFAGPGTDPAANGQSTTLQNEAIAERLQRLEGRLDEHAAKLSEVPTTSQIVSVMEQLLSKTMTSLDERLSTQAHSIEVLKTTVSQTDSLLERVLESLDSLESYPESSEVGEDILFSRAV